jgi:hypothetical protein
MRKLAPGPHLVHACLAAYTQAEGTMRAHNRRPLSDTMKSTIASKIIALAEEGIDDPVVLVKEALADIGHRPLAAE